MPAVLAVVLASVSGVAAVASPVHAEGAAQKTFQQAAANLYCSQKYPNKSSEQTTCEKYYAVGEGQTSGSPNTSSCKSLSKQNAAICKNAITTAAGKAAAAAKSSATTSSGSSGSEGVGCNTTAADCVDANTVGIPEVSVGDGLKDAITILSFVAGVLSVIFLAVGGIRYSTSDGNAQNVSQAKQTITFAVVGLVLSILAPLIVDFVIARGPQ
jgi:hypothetical protein